MKIEISAPVSIHRMGKRGNNEDNLFPPQGKATANDRLFLVCDGVGGSEKGEVASEIASWKIPEYYQRHRVTISDNDTVQKAVAFAQAEIRKYAGENPGSEGMATTLTFLHLHEQGATVAHIGDSRIYQIRNGAVLWRTQDHSYVNDLVKAGVITAEQALTHPRRNVIMRALQAQAGDVQAEVHHITDLRAGDSFFLCSDGILESIDDDKLTNMLAGKIPDQEKMRLIEETCEETSNDNFTAYLIRIESVEILTVELVPDTNISKKEITGKKSHTGPEQKGNSLNVWLIAALVMICSGWYLMGRKKPEKAVFKAKTEQVAVKTDSIMPVHQTKSKKLPVKSKKSNKQR